VWDLGKRGEFVLGIITDTVVDFRAHARTQRLHLSDVARGVVDGSMTIDTLRLNARPRPP